MKKQFPLFCVMLLTAMAAVVARPSVLQGQFYSPQPQAPATPITFGATTFGAIGVPSELDSFTFAADVGDVVLIGISHVSGDLWPRIRLYDPSGVVLADEEGSGHAEIFRGLNPPNQFKLFLPFTNRDTSAQRDPGVLAPRPLIATTPGIYTVVVSDGFNGTRTGSYSLYLQKLNPPAGATTIAYGQTTVGAIGLAAEMDAFTFDAGVGDRFIIGISKISGDMWPEIRLYDPQGVPLNTEEGSGHAEIEHGEGAAGVYTILVSDGFGGQHPGSYSLFIQRLDDPVDATPIAYSQTKSAAIGLAAEMDAYLFNADQDDRFIIGISKTTGPMWPEIRLYNLAGFPLLVTEGSTHAELEYAVTAAGEYALLIADGFGGVNAGSYNLFIQRLNGPVGATEIELGQTKSGAIGLAAEMDAFTFQATANDHMLLTVAKISGGMWPEMKLYGPDGMLLAEEEGSSNAEISQVVPQTGTYTVLVADGFGGVNAGSYNLHLEELP